MNLIGGKAKVVISDASPSLCGIKNIDQLRSIDLTNTVIGIADNILEPKGNLVMKVFQGPEYKDMLQFTISMQAFSIMYYVIVNLQMAENNIHLIT